MSPIIVKDSYTAEKVAYRGDTNLSNQVKFPGQLEIVPPVQFRLYSLYEMARRNLGVSEA